MMRGRRSLDIRARRVATTLAARTRRRPRYDFSAFTDQELEELVALAERGEGAGGLPAWSPAERAVLARLEGKLALVREVTRCD